MPATSTTEIANKAIALLGVGNEIANLDTENSTSARAIRRFYGNALETILGGFPWPFATTFETLGLVATDPNDEWGYSYRYPSDIAKVRRIISGIRNETQDSRIPYKIGKDSTGLLIFTDQPDAVAECTESVDRVELYPPEFVLGLAYLLAAMAAPQLTNGDPFKMMQKYYALYEQTIASAEADAIGEEQPDRIIESEFIRGRD